MPVPPNPLLKGPTRQANVGGIVWRTLRPGDTERAGGAEIRVLHPPSPDWERQRVRNDDSVVLEVATTTSRSCCQATSAATVERALIPAPRPSPLVVLKAAHHGSATSSSDAFLDATRPAAVIFSAGKNNRFGHPATAVVERFARRGSGDVHTPREDGAVFVETDGTRVEVRGMDMAEGGSNCDADRRGVGAPHERTRRHKDTTIVSADELDRRSTETEDE